MNAAQKRFAKEYGMTGLQVCELSALADKAAEANAHACNGDSHPNLPECNDKNQLATEWECTVTDLTIKIGYLISGRGFDRVEYIGLRPCLRLNGQYVEIPHE